MVSTSDMQDKLRDMRFAFERDIVRRSGLVLRGIIGLCEVCGEDFDKIRGNQKSCSNPDCKREMALRRQRKYDQGVATERNERRRVEYSGGERPADPWTNLMVAVVEQAAEDGDIGWLTQHKDIYTRAILGRSLDGQA